MLVPFSFVARNTYKVMVCVFAWPKFGSLSLSQLCTHTNTFIAVWFSYFCIPSRYGCVFPTTQLSNQCIAKHAMPCFWLIYQEFVSFLCLSPFDTFTKLNAVPQLATHHVISYIPFLRLHSIPFIQKANNSNTIEMDTNKKYTAAAPTTVSNAS